METSDRTLSPPRKHVKLIQAFRERAEALRFIPTNPSLINVQNSSDERARQSTALITLGG
eukprot:455053-Pleurochrysis_carterae.AAC.1